MTRSSPPYERAQPATSPRTPAGTTCAGPWEPQLQGRGSWPRPSQPRCARQPACAPPENPSRDDIRRALEAAVAGQGLLDAAVQARLVEAATGRPAWAPAPDGLTEREQQVLSLMAQGLSNTEIASRLYVAESTVKTHVNRIFTKTASRDRPQAIAYAHRHRIG